MTLTPDRLEAALRALGDLLEHRGLRYDLVIVGASAMVLGGVAARPTEDVDVVGEWDGGRIRPRKPFPDDLRVCVHDVGRAMGLPLAGVSGKDWLNPGPSMLARFGDLPRGFADRLIRRDFGALTIRVASRIDLIHLKLYAATDARRPPLRKASDIDDLRALGATREELLAAARWVLSRDGRPETLDLEIRPVLAALGQDVETLDG